MRLDPGQRAMLMGFLAVLCWSTAATAFKLALAHLTPLQLIAIATVTSWAFLLLLLAAQGKLRLAFAAASAAGRASAVLRALCLGAVNTIAFYLVLLHAYDVLPAQEAQALNYTWALTMALLAAPILGHKLRAAELGAALVSYFGVLVIATRGAPLSLEFADPWGTALALASTVLWAGYWLINTRLQARLKRDPTVSLFENFTCALPLLLLFCWWRMDPIEASLVSLSSAIYVGLFEMGIAFVLWQTALAQTTSAARLSSLIFLAPVLSLVLIYFVLGEALLLSTVFGLLAIMAGLGLQQRLTRQEAK